MNILRAKRKTQARQYLNSLSDNQDGCYMTDGRVAYTAYTGQRNDSHHGEDETGQQQISLCYSEGHTT